MSKRERAKVRGNKNVFDEYDWADIDRNEQKAGLARREKRWKEIELQFKREKILEKKAITNAEKMRQPPRGRQPSPLEEAWLRCDFVLYHIMTRSAYNILEFIRTNDPAGYKHLYKIFMSRNMMENITQYVDFFAQGGKVDMKIKKSDMIRHYVKYRGHIPVFKVKHKGEEEHDL